MKTVVKVLAVAGLAGAMLSGCSDTSMTNGPAGVSLVPSPAPVPTGARKELTESSCVAAKGVWRLTGTLRNTSGQRSSYTIRASVVRTADSAVVGSKEITQALQPGGRTRIAIESITVTKDVKGLQCVPTVTVVRN